MRFYSGFTLRQVEELTGISNSYLSQLENGKVKKPSYEFVTRLISLYNTTPMEEKAIQILKELCQLKKYKDTVGKDSFYEKRQPQLWKEANDFLRSIELQNLEVSDPTES